VALTKVTVELDGVPATMLWTLHHRAVEARRPDRVLNDAKAIDVFDSLDYPFPQMTGAQSNPQWIALRCRCFDEAVLAFLADHPDGTVVSLGEGLETMFWRVDNGRVHWLTVDLPEAIELRQRLLPPESERQRYLVGSAVDPSWQDAVDASRGVLVVVQGLLMYLRPPEVRSVIAGCAERFPGAAMVLDTMPRKFAEWQQRSGDQVRAGFEMPKWRWLVDADQQQQLATAHANIVEVRNLPYPRGRGLIGWLLPQLGRFPLRVRSRTTVVRLGFGSGA
jgi:O-methyltransferase involved in polyketide biosynthesis